MQLPVGLENTPLTTKFLSVQLYEPTVYKTGDAFFLYWLYSLDIPAVELSVSIVTWLGKEMTKLLNSIKLLVFVLWTSNLIFQPKVVESRVRYSALYKDYGQVHGDPHRFDVTVDEDLKEEADLPQTLNFDGKLYSKEYL